jgi:hypothetical protein
MFKKTSSTRKKIKIPKSFQGILWSVNVKNLDLEKDKVYIIHQVLMYGNLKQIRWLFQVYGKKEIRRVFEETPMKIYSPQCFNFVKNIILNLKEKSLPTDKYITLKIPGKNLEAFWRSARF